MQYETKQHIANVASNILNPILMSLLIIFLLAFSAGTGTLDTLKWAGISIVIGLVPVVLIVLYLVQNDRLDTVFINTREQRTKIYLLGSVCAVAGYAVLALLKAPPMLLAAFAAGFATTIVFMLINLRWKISMHTAMVADSVTVLAFLFGWFAAIGAVLLPLTAWSRVELKRHSLAQTITSAVLSSLIVVVVFHQFGRVS
ncbi:MAG: hypothetical protein ABIH70_09270 [Chloroflexota bacterium]